MELFGRPVSPEIARVLDDKAWRSYLRSRLSDGERRRLRGEWRKSDSRRLALGRRAYLAATEHKRFEWTSQDEEFEWRWWAAQVLRIEVEVNYRGLATLRDPYMNYAVRITWRKHPGSGTPLPVEIAIVAPRGEFIVSALTEPPTWAGTHIELWESVPWLGETLILGPYLAALRLQMSRLEREPFTRVPVRRSQPGRPPDAAFYSKLLRRHDEIKAEGHTDATVRLTREMQKKDPAVTKEAVKQWLRRGRTYLEREGGSVDRRAPRPEQTWQPQRRPPKNGDSDA